MNRNLAFVRKRTCKRGMNRATRRAAGYEYHRFIMTLYNVGAMNVGSLYVWMRMLRTLIDL